MHHVDAHLLQQAHLQLMFCCSAFDFIRAISIHGAATTEITEKHMQNDCRQRSGRSEYSLTILSSHIHNRGPERHERIITIAH